MSRAKRLAIVERLAVQREEQASQALAQVRMQIETEEKRLDELVEYRQEYLNYLEKQGAQGISMQQWHRTQSFIDQLVTLSGRQQSTIDAWRSREQQILEKWRELYQRRKNVGRFVDKISTEEAIAADKQEQKLIDELISQRYS